MEIDEITFPRDMYRIKKKNSTAIYLINTSFDKTLELIKFRTIENNSERDIFRVKFVLLEYNVV